MNQEFLDYVEEEMSKNGAIELTPAISKFIQPTDLTIDRHIAFLHGTGKYVIVRGFVTKNLLIERNPNFDTGQSVIETNKSVQETNGSIKTLNAATQNNYSTQIRLTIANVVVAIAAVIISTIALFKGDSPEAKRQRTELIQKFRLIDSISQHHKGIDSSLKILVERSLPKDSNSLNNIRK